MAARPVFAVRRRRSNTPAPFQPPPARPPARWVDALEWAGAPAWPSAAPVEWSAEGEVAGTVREVGPLSFVRVYKAGHMVPMDQPMHAAAMIARFTRGMSLASGQPRQSLAEAVQGRPDAAAAGEGGAGGKAGAAAELQSTLKAVLGRHQIKVEAS